jgi:hypothetical protein
MLLVTIAIPTFIALGAVIMSMGVELGGLEVVAFTVVLAALAYLGMVHAGWCGTSYQLAIYDERVVLDPGDTAVPSHLTIRFADIEQLELDRRWIRVRMADGGRFSFRGAALHVEDAFDVLVERVEAARPGCAVVDRR